MAAYAAASKVDSFAEMPALNLGQAMTNFTAIFAMVGVMAAAVYVASAFLQIPIPTVIDNMRLHMGNVICLLSGLLLGPVQGVLVGE